MIVFQTRAEIAQQINYSNNLFVFVLNSTSTAQQ